MMGSFVPWLAFRILTSSILLAWSLPFLFYVSTLRFISVLSIFIMISGSFLSISEIKAMEEGVFGMRYSS